jgi:hypothetical protein
MLQAGSSRVRDPMTSFTFFNLLNHYIRIKRFAQLLTKINIRNRRIMSLVGKAGVNV